MEEDQRRALAIWLIGRVRDRKTARRRAIIDPLDRALSGGEIENGELLRLMRLLALVQEKSDADLTTLATLLADDSRPVSIPDAMLLLLEAEGGGPDGTH